MNYDFIIFGKSSILSKNLIQNINNRNNQIIFITREGHYSNDITCNLGEKILPFEINKISLNIENLSRYKKKVFILFAWSGGPRTSFKEDWIINLNIMIGNA